MSGNRARAGNIHQPLKTPQPHSASTVWEKIAENPEDDGKLKHELPGTGFVLYDKRYERPVFGMAKVSKRELIRWTVRENQIMMVEILAVVQLIAAVGHNLRKKKLIIFVDSQSAEGALVKGGSSKEDVSELVMVFWRLIQAFEILVYIDRVPTDSNISDSCSRGSRDLALRLGWTELEIPESLDWACGWLGPG